MTAQLWLPGAERVAGVQTTGSMAGGPPRSIWHYTADKLNKDGTRGATFEDVRDYLVKMGYEPHLLIDPFSGRTAQFLPFNRFAAAAVHRGDPQTNRMGTACIQVEWFFTPGLVHQGKKYAKLSDTPLQGVGPFLAACDSWGIPRVYRGGRNRDVKVWETEAGHYGHIDVPENDHIDPTPMDWSGVLANPPRLTVAARNRGYATLRWTGTHGATGYDVYQDGTKVAHHAAGQHVTSKLHGRHVFRVVATGPGLRVWSNVAVVVFP
jgi:hypothetical protein